MTGKKPLSLYLHFPFCVRKCRYCDFLSFPGGDRQRQEYVEVLCREIRLRSRDFDGHEVETVFFGGGTPSLLETGQLSTLMEAIRESFSLAEGAEISLECNPGTVTEDKLRSFQRLGINRLSIGLQSAKDEELAFLGRIHTEQDFLQTWQAAREAGFDNMSVDLMSGLPGQTLASHEKSLDKVLSLGPDHLSVYSLILEEGTDFYRLYGDGDAKKSEKSAPPPLPSEEEERAMYHLTRRRLLEAGYEHYEISNYARPGMACRHNLVYWKRGEYLGLGLGAASLVGEKRMKNQSKLSLYMEDCLALEECEPVSLRNQMEETMFLGLRCLQGVSLEEFARRFSRGIPEVYPDVIRRYEALSLLEITEGRLRLTEKGIDVSNWILADFLL